MHFLFRPKHLDCQEAPSNQSIGFRRPLANYIFIHIYLYYIGVFLYLPQAENVLFDVPTFKIF